MGSLNKERDYIEEVRTNPRIYCYNDCCMEDCPKHSSRVDWRTLYLFANMKDTPYCPMEDREDYGEVERWKAGRQKPSFIERILTRLLRI